MDSVLNFLANNYLIFLIISGVLFFALIGFIVVGKKKAKEEGEGAEQPKEETKPEEMASLFGDSSINPPSVDENAKPGEPTLVIPDPATEAAPETPSEPIDPDAPSLVIPDPAAETAPAEETPVTPEVTPETPAEPVAETQSIFGDTPAEPTPEVPSEPTPEVPSEPAPVENTDINQPM